MNPKHLLAKPHHRLLVCTHCKTSNPETGPEKKSRLTKIKDFTRRLRVLLGHGTDKSVDVWPCRCVGTCNRPYVVIFQGEDQEQLIFGDIQLTEPDAKMVVDCFDSYRRKGQHSRLMWDERPERMREELLVRLPSMKAKSIKTNEKP